MRRKWIGWAALGIAAGAGFACSGTNGKLNFLGMGREDPGRNWTDIAQGLFSPEQGGTGQEPNGVAFCVQCGQVFKCTAVVDGKTQSANIQVPCPSSGQTQLCTDTGDFSSSTKGSSTSTSTATATGDVPAGSSTGGSSSGSNGSSSSSSSSGSSGSTTSVHILPGGGFDVTVTSNGKSVHVTCYPTNEPPTVNTSSTGTSTSTSTATNPTSTTTATGTGTVTPIRDAGAPSNG